MSTIKISYTKDHFLKNGRKFFYLADTVWSAFTNASFEEWEEYLDYRRTQGFNALQINILPQHDRSEPVFQVGLPFELGSNGKMDFTKPNEQYFLRVEKMLETACEKGFTPALVVLWCNYVKGTWGSRINPDEIIPLELVGDYVSYVAERFRKFKPVFIASGDTNFETDEATAYYKLALDTLKRKAGECLTTMHICGGLSDMPEELENSPSLDFYMFQSGHVKEGQNIPYILAEKFYKKKVKRPVVNGEPCYEGISHGTEYERFSAFDVRKEIWQSLLSGAKAGVTYGAHGIWPWHKKGRRYRGWPFGGIPYEWRIALRFPGAWDAAFAKWFFEKNDLFNLEPANDILLNETPEIRVSKNHEKIAVYSPFNADVKIRLNVSGYEWEAVELRTRKIFKAEIETSVEQSTIKMHKFNSDVLFIGEKY